MTTEAHLLVIVGWDCGWMVLCRNGASLCHSNQKTNIAYEAWWLIWRALDRYFRTQPLLVSGNGLLTASNFFVHCVLH